MTDAPRTHAREQRMTLAEDAAHAAASYYLTLRARKLPATAASAITEAWVTATAGTELPPDPWTP